MSNLNFPKRVEEDKRCEAIRSLFSNKDFQLWDDGKLVVPLIDLNERLVNGLNLLKGTKKLTIGLETIEGVLKTEQKGLEDRKGGTEPSSRMSRLLIISKGGSVRFFREVEKIVGAYADRVQCIAININGDELGQTIFRGQNKKIQALLVSDKQALVKFLLGLVPK